MAKATRKKAGGAKIVRFDRKGPKLERGKPGKVLAGKPATTTRNFFTDGSGQLFSGIWSSTKGKWSVTYDEDEFIYLISGKCRLTDADGHAETFKADDAFVIPKGFTGTWETLETLKKYYVIYAPQSAA